MAMNPDTRRLITYELVWLGAILALSALAEYIIIVFFDLHPVLSVKIQGVIGLIIFGYAIRMVGRLISQYKTTQGSDEEESKKK